MPDAREQVPQAPPELCVLLELRTVEPPDALGCEREQYGDQAAQQQRRRRLQHRATRLALDEAPRVLDDSDHRRVPDLFELRELVVLVQRQIHLLAKIHLSLEAR